MTRDPLLLSLDEPVAAGADTCTRCAGIGSVCLACDLAIDDCECMDDAMPCTCARCEGHGLEPDDEQDGEAA